MIEKAINIDFDFTLDTPGFWDSFNTNYKLSSVDPDIFSPTLRRYHQILWSRKLPNGELMNLELSGNPRTRYLVWNGMRFGSDSIINCYLHTRKIKSLINEIIDDVGNFAAFHQKYLHESYRIGQSIIFPKHRNSLNQCRGMNRHIQDRFDLTLECIRRYYSGEESPLYNALERDESFFLLFRDFKGYVDFFYLNDIVSEDYSGISFFLNFDDFKRNPLPENKQEWHELYRKQMLFLQRRGERIERTLNGNLTKTST